MLKESMSVLEWMGQTWRMPTAKPWTHYRLTPQGQLEEGLVQMVPVPESEWPTQPGDPWHGLVGIRREEIVGWQLLLPEGRFLLEAPDGSEAWLVGDGEGWEIQLPKGDAHAA